MIGTITSKGQITLPKAIRDKLRLHTGDKVDFFIREDGRVEIVPMTTSIRSLKGMITPSVRGVSLEDMDEAIAKGALDDEGN